MSQMNFPNSGQDPWKNPAVQVEAPPLPVYSEFAKIKEGKNAGMVWGHDVGLRSHLRTHLREIPDLAKHLVTALSNAEIDFRKMVGEEKLGIEVDMGEPTGTTDQVRIADPKKVYYAIREGRPNIYTKFEEGRESPETTKVAIFLAESPDKKFCGIIHTAWTGPLAPSFPYHNLALTRPEEYERGVEHWSGQDIALTDRHMAIIPGTRRRKCPWAVEALALHASQAINLTENTWTRLRQE